MDNVSGCNAEDSSSKLANRRLTYMRRYNWLHILSCSSMSRSLNYSVAGLRTNSVAVFHITCVIVSHVHLRNGVIKKILIFLFYLFIYIRIIKL